MLPTQPIAREMLIPVFETLDTALRARGMRSGIPFGIGAEHISTLDPELQRLLDEVGQPQCRQEGAITSISGFEFLKILAQAGVDIAAIKTPDDFKPIAGRFHIVNTWFVRLHHRYRGGLWVKIIRDREKGKTYLMKQEADTATSRFTLVHNTLVLRSRYSFGTLELRAQELLREVLSDEQWEQYILEGAFIERGRSGVEYIVRKGRPTIAFRQKLKSENDGVSIVSVNHLAALCLHPLAYYTDTWAGAMPPSDEVLAHLLLIRSDEHRFWKEANHFPLDAVGSGI